MTQRRDFLKQAGILSAAMLLSNPVDLLAKKRSLKTGIQLYSLRDYIPKDVKGVLAKVADAGYKDVETYGFDVKTKTYWKVSATDLKSILNDNGLTATSGHYSMDKYIESDSQEDMKLYIEAAHTLGHTAITLPSVNKKFLTNVEGFKMVTNKINKMAELFKKEGLKTAYHNHDFEFKSVDGTRFYDVLLKETNPELVSFEMDIYWIVRANEDPISLIKANPGRFTAWHVKDMDKANPKLNTEVGNGSINFKAISKYKKLSGLKRIYVEQENFAMDAFQSIRQSATYIKKELI